MEKREEGKERSEETGSEVKKRCEKIGSKVKGKGSDTGVGMSAM